MEEHRYIVFNTKTDFLKIDLEKVVYFQSDGNYTNIMTVNRQQETVCIGLGQMEKLISMAMSPAEGGARFMRIGKQFIVNMNFIYQVSAQRQRLVLSDSERFKFAICISSEALKKLKKILVDRYESSIN